MPRVASVYHGNDIGSRLWHSWRNMRQRCYNPACPVYEHYGARGITVTYRWGSYAEFRAWAILDGYNDGLTLDRIDNDSGYSPDNCRWVTQAEQLRNTRVNRAVRRSDGVVFRSIAEAAEATRCDRSSISKCCTRTFHYRTAGGYGWQYLDEFEEQCFLDEKALKMAQEGR